MALSLAAMAGALLFWVQHNHEQTWHGTQRHWSPVVVALRGSSHLRLPFPLSWFTANIGLHHVHHLNPRIPNYRLEGARRELPGIRDVAPLTMTDVRQSFTHVFWDEEAQRQVRLQDVQ